MNPDESLFVVFAGIDSDAERAFSPLGESSGISGRLSEVSLRGLLCYRFQSSNAVLDRSDYR